MRIGELLIEQRKLRASDLTRALAEKPPDRRLASFLIAKGLVDFDEASRALGEQKQVSCALAKHLAGRDPALAKLIPAELGRASCVLPIGRTSKGAVIVCVRDPAASLLSTLEKTIKASVLMIVAPSMRLEYLVAEAYGRSDGDFELDIDFDSKADQNPLAAAPEPHVPRRPLTTPPAPFARVQATPSSPPMPDMSALDPESVRLSLTDLDDVRVDKDFTQSGQIPLPGGTLPPSTRPLTTPPVGTLPPSNRPSTPSTLPPATRPGPEPLLPPSNRPSTPSSTLPPSTRPNTQPPLLPPSTRPNTQPPLLPPSTRPTAEPLLPPSHRPAAQSSSPLAAIDRPSTTPPSISNNPTRRIDPPVAASANVMPRAAGYDPKATRPMSLDMMQVGLEHATTREAATDLVLAYVATRWLAGIVLAVRDKAAIGYRGHAVASPENVTVSLGSPSTVQRAVQSRFVSVEAPSGVGQSALTHALNGSTAPAAAPVMVAGQAVAVIAVGDPIAGTEARDACAVDLAMLAEALGAAYGRIMAR